MKNWSNPTVFLQIISIIIGVISIIISLYILSFVTIPYQQATLKRSADIVLDVIPSLGRIDNGFYFTQTKPVNADLVIDFYVIIWNRGNKSAENITITLRVEPQTSSWFDYHWSIVSISGFSYRPSSNTAFIRALLPNQQAQIQYHVRFKPSDYDQIIKAGKEPKIIIELSSVSTSQRYEYIVRMP